MNDHTPGKLAVIPHHPTAIEFAGNAGGFDLRDCPAPETNARRLVACWNFCEHLSTEQLEAMITAGLRAYNLGRKE